MPSQVVIRGGAVIEPNPDNRRQQVNHNPGTLNSNPMYQTTAQQSSNMTVSV